MSDATPLAAVSALIVDDQPFARNILRQFLTLMGITDIREAEDGSTALTTCRDRMPDAVLCDLQMTPMKGLEFLAALRAEPVSEDAQPTVILMSASPSGADLRDAEAGGAAAVLTKPIQMDELETTLRRSLSR